MKIMGFAVLMVFCLGLTGAQAASADLSQAGAAELREIIARLSPPLSTAGNEKAQDLLLRGEARMRLGHSTGNTGLIETGLEDARLSETLAAQEEDALLALKSKKQQASGLSMLARQTEQAAYADQALDLLQSLALPTDLPATEWMGLQNTFGIALWTRGSLLDSTPPIEAAIERYRTALIDPRADVAPLEAIKMRVNLATTLVDLALRASRPPLLVEALQIYEVLSARDGLAAYPDEQATVRLNFAQALTVYGWRTKNTDELERATELYKQAIAYWRAQGALQKAQGAEDGLRQTYDLLSRLYGRN